MLTSGASRASLYTEDDVIQLYCGRVGACIPLEKKQVPSASWEGGGTARLFVLFSFSPQAQQRRKHEEKSTRGPFLPRLPRLWRRIAKEPGEKAEHFNSVNFETLSSDSCSKVSSIRIHLPSCCFSQTGRLDSKDVSISCSLVCVSVCVSVCVCVRVPFLPSQQT